MVCICILEKTISVFTLHWWQHFNKQIIQSRFKKIIKPNQGN